MKKGIDVSEFNNYIDWSKVKKAGIDFALIRSTFGVESQSQIDAQYFQNAQGCVKNNIPFATYHMAYFVNEQTAKAEANFAIKKANEYKQYIKFIVLDLEDDSERYAKSIGCNPDWTSCTIAFLEQIKSAGYVPVLYSNQTWLTTRLNYNKIKNYKLWYAAPYVSKPAYTCAIWQYDWKGKVNGINGDVDMDYLYDNSLFDAFNTTIQSSTNKTSTTTVDDKTKFLNTAKNYIGKNGHFVCIDKLNLGMIVDWCAYSISAIMKDCGFIGKYQGDIYGYASDAARKDNGKLGVWFKKGEKTPQPGDYIMFRYASFTNPIDKYSASHVGIVEAVNGNILTTLEGNVDGYGNDWAGTSSFKRKTRYLSNPDVYAFYRPNWQGEKNSISTGAKGSLSAGKATASGSGSGIDAIYQVHTIGGKWLPQVKNLDDFAGLEGKKIDGISVMTSKYHIRYRVRLWGKKTYEPWITDRSGFAGKYNYAIDRVQMEFYGDDNISKYAVEYRVSTVESKSYLEWVRGYNNKNDDGYAGLDKRCIDKLQIRIVKK